MFRVLCTVCLVGCCLSAALVGCARSADPTASGVTVRTTGDAQIYGVYRSQLQPGATR